MSDDGRATKDEAVLSRLHGVRDELRALREAFEKQGYIDEVDGRISENEVEQRLYQIDKPCPSEAASQ